MKRYIRSDAVSDSFKNPVVAEHDVVVVNTEGRPDRVVELYPVVVDHVTKAAPQSTFWGWVYREMLRQYYFTEIVYHAKDYRDAENWIKKHRKMTVEELENELKNTDSIFSSDSIHWPYDENDDRHPIDEELLNFLSDIDFTHELFKDQDLSQLKITDEEEKQLNRCMYWYMIAAEDQNQKRMDEYAHRAKEIVINLPDYVYLSSQVMASSDVTDGEWVIVNMEGRLNRPARFIPVKVETVGAFGPRSFSGWAHGERLNEYDFSHVVTHCPDYDGCKKWIEDHKGMTTDELRQHKDVLASEDNKKPFIVHYSYDTGDAESGPIIHTGWDIFYADDEKSAEAGWEAEYAETSAGYEGCWAEPATQEDVDKWNQDMKDLDNLPSD